LFDEVREALPPLRGIIHAAGILDDGLLSQQSLERFNQVAAPKIYGAWNLHVLSREAPLDFFVMFSSAATLLGSPGQGNYSAANAFLDGLAHYRNAAGLPGLSINWGPWAEVGLAALEERGEKLAQQGINSLTPREGVNVFGQLLKSSTPPQVMVMALELERWSQHCSAAGSPLFSGIATVARQNPTGNERSETNL